MYLKLNERAVVANETYQWVDDDEILNIFRVLLVLVTCLHYLYIYYRYGDVSKIITWTSFIHIRLFIANENNSCNNPGLLFCKIVIEY